MKQDVAKVVLIVGSERPLSRQEPDLVFFADSVFAAALAARLHATLPDGSVWSIARNRVRGRVQRQDAALVLNEARPTLRRGSSWRLARLELCIRHTPGFDFGWLSGQSTARLFLDTAFELGARVEIRRPYEFWLEQSGDWRMVNYLIGCINRPGIRETPASPLVRVTGRCDALEVVHHVQRVDVT